MVIGYIRDVQISAGVPRALVYDRTMYILVGFLLVGLICNALVRPVHSRWLMSDAAAEAGTSKAASPTGSFGIGLGGLTAGALLAWLAVGIPFAWGVWSTVVKAIALFS